MKILLHSNAPWMTTGYGQQAGLLATGLMAHGHQVAISAFCGLEGPPVAWHGAKVLPSVAAGDPLGSALLAEHAKAEEPDLVITLCDVWALETSKIDGLPLACWLPVDCAPLSKLDAAHLTASCGIPVAMSRHGQKMLTAAGFDPLYVPHCLSPAYTAPRDRQAARERVLGDAAGSFAIGINATNKDPYRKGLAEQFAAFARFHQEVPASVLLVHTRIAEPGSLDLSDLVADLGIEDAVRFAPQAELLTGQIDTGWLADWYTALDLYSGCAYGEGFGLPILEAQACGTPVVVTDASAMTELCGSGYLVSGEPFWNPVHRAWWSKPYIQEITDAYSRAWQITGTDPGQAKDMRGDARSFAALYTPAHVLGSEWPKVLHEACRRLAGQRPAGTATDPVEVASAIWAGLPRGGHAWDIGANQGQSLAQLYALCDRVTAFEPSAEAIDALDAAWDPKPPWLAGVHELAVSDHDGHLTTAIRDKSAEALELTAVGVESGLPWGRLAGTRDVPCRTVDSLAGEMGIPDLIKVDTEGHEGQVLDGAAKVLAAGTTSWVIEFHSAALHGKCSNLLAAAGYAVETVRHPHYPPDSRLWHNHGWIRATPIPPLESS
jgi:FkbM family methyltransferase